MKINRRIFLKQTSLLTASVALISTTPFIPAWGSSDTKTEMRKKLNLNNDLKISLAQWSLHRSFFGDSLKKGWGFFAKTIRENPDALYQGTLNPDDFPGIAINDYGIDNIELVNTFYYSKANNPRYWDKFKQKCDNLGVSIGLIMCDALGNTGDSNVVARSEAIKKHHAWIDIAKKLGAHSVRVNAAGQGNAKDVAINVIDGLRKSVV